MLSRIAVCGLLLIASSVFGAEPLSKAYSIDFFRDVPSRNLKGLATRSDGKLVLGPVLTDLNGPLLPQLVWCIEPSGDRRWLIGTGPEGKIVEVSLEHQGATYSVRDVIKLDQPQVLTLKRLDDGSILAGTSPNGVLVLVREGKAIAQVALPADSIFDLAIRGGEAFVATGNPARIFRVDLRAFAAAGMDAATGPTSLATLKAKGIAIFGEIRDRNIRRLAWVGDELIAGSSPKGNLYRFSATGGSPQILQENRDAEVAALLPQANGDLFAALVFTTAQAETRINRPAAKSDAPEAAPAPEHFSGRSSVVYFPKNGFPETIVARSGLSFYALARRNNLLLIAGGEQGDVLGYDLVAREGLSFAGSDSAQVNALLPIAPPGDAADQFLALRNNVSGISILDFATGGPRSAETKRLDLGIPARLGALRLAHLADASPEQIHIEAKTNLGSDDIEGWSAWSPAEHVNDGWLAANARGRNVKLRIQISPTAGTYPELDDATLYYLPQNRRPQLSEFRIAPPNFALQATQETPPAISNLGQLLGNGEHDDKRKNALLNSSVVPEPGNQIVFWVVTDPDGDNVTCDFAIRREGTSNWTDIAVGTHDSFVQFNTTHFEDGVYLTRLIASEQSPRPAAERLTTIFDTDAFIIDHTPPTITDVAINRDGDTLRISVSGHDTLSLLDNAEFVFNNGYHEVVAQPADGIRDSQTETFILQAPVTKVAGATSVEIRLSDAAGNHSARREKVP